MLSARNRELLGLVPAAILVTGGFAAIFIQDRGALSTVSLTYGGAFLALCFAGHVVIRRALPDADPYLFPLAAALASVGIVEIYRINPTLARDQAQWLVLGLVLFAITVTAFRDGRYMRLENYRYLIAIAGIGSLLLPRLPGIGGQDNGIYLAVHIGGLSFQPAEFGKIAIVIFLASYLRDNRQVLVTAGRRILGLTIPPMKQFGPLLLVWGSAMAMLLVTREIGTSLMFFGAFLALLYVATGRLSFPLVGLVLFAAGAYYFGTHVAHIHQRVLAWEHPFDNSLYHQDQGSYQLANGLFAQADGGLLGVGFDQSILTSGRATLLPVADSDSIYAVITNEVGLVGAIGLLLTYVLFVARGLKVATLARDSFSKLLATGLAFIIALQVFVIVGGVTDVIPLTGVTLPFVAYGGSSVVMNFVLLALLLVISDRARRPA
ncbi:MAG TPA: FtsW/RodA/SpoVE family cell cycle protein [Solirubrobacteraceae bacterium]|nr:FtsW/RodA/SpoVE family cell cycle protein [Solirubrobacteraceae bacterium]